MKTLLVLLFLLLPAGGAKAESDPGPDDQVFRLGVSTRTFPAANRNDALAALRVWVDTVIREKNLRGSAEIALYESGDALRAAYERGDIDAATLTTEETMLLGMQPDHIYLPSQAHGFDVRYVLLVHRDGGIEDLADLASRKVVFFNNQYMVLALPWLETLFAEVAGQRVDLREMNFEELNNPSKAILQVFFHQAQGALVTMEAFELACELNPQLRNELMIFHESPPFVPKMFVFRPDWQGTTRNQLEEAMLNLHTTPGGQQVLTVFQSSRLSRQPASVLDPTRRFIEDYRQLADAPSSRKSQP